MPRERAAPTFTPAAPPPEPEPVTPELADGAPPPEPEPAPEAPEPAPAAPPAAPTSLPVPALDPAGATLDGVPDPAPEPTPEIPAPRKRRGGGRRRRTEAPPEAPAPPGDAIAAGPTPEQVAEIAGVLGTTWALAGQVTARFAGEHWRLTPEESRRLGDAWAPVLAPYLPRVAGYLPWVGAVVATVDVLGPRVWPAPEPAPAPDPQLPFPIGPERGG